MLSSPVPQPPGPSSFPTVTLGFVPVPLVPKLKQSKTGMTRCNSGDALTALFSSWGKNKLDKHLRSSFCTKDYPNTLRCPKCEKEFVTMSKLMTHVGDKPQCKLKRGEDNVFGPLVLYLEKELAARDASVRGQRVQYRLLSGPWTLGEMTVQVRWVMESELEQPSIPHISGNGDLAGATSDAVHGAEAIRVDDAELENALETVRSDRVLSDCDLNTNHATSSHAQGNRRLGGYRIPKSSSPPDKSGSIQLESPASGVASTPTLGDGLQSFKCGNAISDHNSDASNHTIPPHGHRSRLLGDYGIPKIYPNTDGSGGLQQENRASDAAFTTKEDLALEAPGLGDEKGETQGSFQALGNRTFDDSGAFLRSFRDKADTHDESLDSEIVFSGRGRGQRRPRRNDDGCSSSEARDEDASDGGVGI
ncbi:MAG: hypothetical protein Q9181_006244 [Wetmoreana brouardii]